MKKFNTIYYLLFILLVMGAFAAMAQNNYGLNIMGGVAFVFGLLFLTQLYSLVSEKGEKNMMGIAEMAGLFLLTVIMGLRVFYIHFTYVEILFAMAGVLLLLVYLRKMILRYKELKHKNNFLAMLILLFHVSIILFLASLVLMPFAPKVGEMTGAAAFAGLLIFIALSIYKKKLMLEGDNISAFKKVSQFKDHSIIIISLFLLFSLYVGFNRIGVLPVIYSDEFPQTYYKLVNDAASKKEKPVDGNYKHEVFKEKYDEFIKNKAGK